MNIIGNENIGSIMTQGLQLKNYQELFKQLDDLKMDYVNLQLKNASNSKVTEYIMHGFLRRVGILEVCIAEVLKIFPFDLTKLPNNNGNSVGLLTIFLQAHIVNICGALDNLARIYNHIFDLQLTKHDISLFKIENNKKEKCPLYQKLPDDLKQKIEKYRKWHDNYLQNYRHALMHRVPLYIPKAITHDGKWCYEEIQKKKQEIPNDISSKEILSKMISLEKDQEKLFLISNEMTHSYSEPESKPMKYREQMIADLLTLIVIAKELHHVMIIKV
jgi:hypothetical protein